MYLSVGQKCLLAVAAAHQQWDPHGWVGRQKQLPGKLACLDQEQRPAAAAAAGRPALQQLQVGTAANCSCLAGQRLGCWEQQLLQQVQLPGLHQHVGLQQLKQGSLQVLQSWVGVHWLQAEWMGEQTAQPRTAGVAARHLQTCLRPEWVPDWLQALLQVAAVQAAAGQGMGPGLQWVGRAAAFGLLGPASAGRGWRQRGGAHPEC